MPTLPDTALILLNKINFRVFLCFSKKFSQFFSKSEQSLGHFCTLASYKDYVVTTMINAIFDGM